MAVRILPLDMRRFDEALEFVCREFVTGSVLHEALGIGAEEYTDYMCEPVNKMVGEQLSFIAVNPDDTIVACVLAGEYKPPQSERLRADKKPEPPAFIKPINALLDQLDEAYWAMRAENIDSSDNKTLLIDIGVVSREMQGTGLYQKLRAKAVQHAQGQGFTRIVSELSSAITQYIGINKLGYTVISEIEYASFEYDGRRPFASITDPTTIIMVERCL